MLTARRMMVHLQLRVPSRRILSTHSLWLLSANLKVKQPKVYMNVELFYVPMSFPFSNQYVRTPGISRNKGLILVLYSWDYHPRKLPRLLWMKPWPTWTCPQSRSSKSLSLMTAKLLQPSDHERHMWWKRLWTKETCRLYPTKRYFARHWKYQRICFVCLKVWNFYFT